MKLNPFRCRMCGKELGRKPLDTIYCSGLCRKNAHDARKALDKGLPIPVSNTQDLGLFNVTAHTVEQTVDSSGVKN